MFQRYGVLALSSSRRCCRRRRRSRSSCCSPASPACAGRTVHRRAIAIGRGIRYFGDGLAGRLLRRPGRRVLQATSTTRSAAAGARAGGRRRWLWRALWPLGQPRRAGRTQRSDCTATVSIVDCGPSTHAPDLSVVIPMRNEAPNLEELYRELTDDARARAGAPYEIIVVDDGSTDETLRDAGARCRRATRALRVIRFRRNFGQTAAFAAGFAHARGALHRHVGRRPAERSARHPGDGRRSSSEGADIVCGWRKDRKDAFLTRRLPSMIANRLISWATGVQAARLRLLAEGVPRRGRQAAEAVRRDAPVPAGDRERAGRARSPSTSSTTGRALHGQSKYGISRTIRVVLDLMTVKFLLSYSTRPLQIFGLLGRRHGRPRRC